MVGADNMLNDIDFDYLDLGLPNLVWAKKKTKTYDKPVKINERLAPLAYAAAKKFPRWTFVGMVSYGYDDRFEVIKFNVYENREKVGTIGTNQTRQGTKFTLTGDRIRKIRKRGNAAETKDLKKAVSIMTKTFGAGTTAEKMEAFNERLYSSMHVGYSEKNAEYQHSLHHVQKFLIPYIVDNFDAIRDAVVAAGANPDVVDKLPSRKADVDTVLGIVNCRDKKMGCDILIAGDRYLVKYGGDSITHTMSSDKLPANIRRNLGMLKLVDDRSFVGNVGFRVDETQFFVLDTEPTDE